MKHERKSKLLTAGGPGVYLVPARVRASDFGLRDSAFGIRTAFTLIELVVVMTLLVVVVSIAWPTLAHFFRGRTLDSEARRLLALTRQGQSRAVSEGVPIVLWVDAARRTYGLEEQSSYTDHDARAVEYTLDRDLQMEVVNGNEPAAIPNLSAQVSGSHLNVPAIRFQPDGSIDENSLQSVRLLDREGISFWLAQSRNRLNYEIRNTAN